MSKTNNTMTPKEKMNFILQVLQSCDTKEQLFTTRKWGKSLIESWDICRIQKQEYNNSLFRVVIL